MSMNQFPFEVARDIATQLLEMKCGDELFIYVKARGKTCLLDWTSSRGDATVGVKHLWL